jgi:ubiquinol-cytochrome c reductase cytochrome b subunit
MLGSVSPGKRHSHRELREPRVDLERVGEKAGGAIDDRFHAAKYARAAMQKAFPDQWSFFLGELALYTFLILIVTGIFLTFFFDPSEREIVYHGSYTKLDGVPMTEAYQSAVNLTFDVRGGLLVRQIHHWAANIFVGAIALHALRIFFTGAFRKPRELNWVIGTTMFALACVEGFAGYSLPDDLLSGTGVRIAEGIMQSIPIIGTYVVFFVFGGQYPGQDFIPRLYIAHVLLLPGLILALVTAHLMILWHQGHTQWPGKKEKEHVEVGAPMFPLFMMKTTSLFIYVFGALALLATFAQINPIWLYGPYDPVNVSNGSQPDWYIGFLEGALRMMPGAESNFGSSVTGGHTIMWNVFIPAVLLPVIFFVLMYAYPFFERWVIGDNRPHNVLDRPRYTPTRTGIGVAVVTSAVVLQIAGGDDVIAFHLGIAVEDLVWVTRVSFFVLPVIAFFVTRHVCVALQRADRRRLRVGHPYGITAQSLDGLAPDGYSPDGTALGRTGARPEPGGVVARPGPATLAPGQADGHVLTPQPELSYATVNYPLTEQEQERLTAHRPDELIRPIPRHLVPLPSPRRIAAQVRARLNHVYLVSALEPPYKTRASNGQSAKESVESDERPTRE